MAIEYSKLRSIVFEYLRRQMKSRERNHPLNLIRDGGREGWQTLCREHGVTPDDADFEMIQQIFHELYLERILITGSGPNSLNAAMSWPFYRVTEYGKKVLEKREYVPHDPDGYLARIKSEIPDLDGVILRYLEEALGCFRSDFLLAAAVMIGCAAEKALLLLVEAFGDAIADAARKARYEQDTKSWMISRKYAALWKELEAQASSLPRELGDDLHVILDRIFDLIRTTRNEAGHPTGGQIERETVHANLILFPSYCRRVYALMDYFRENPVT